MRWHLLLFATLAAASASIVACGESTVVEPSGDQTANASGPPAGYQACYDKNFAGYLDTCTESADCTGAMACDLTYDFAATSRCHGPQCEDDADCAAKFKDLCTGTDFHWECRASNSRVPKECRIVEGAKP